MPSRWNQTNRGDCFELSSFASSASMFIAAITRSGLGRADYRGKGCSGRADGGWFCWLAIGFVVESMTDGTALRKRLPCR